MATRQKAGSSKKPKSRAPAKKKAADRADPFVLYQESVQAPAVDTRFFDRIFNETFGKSPLALREDFSGTGALCAEWVRSHPERTAVGIDLDEPTLEWGRKHNLALLSKEAKARARLVQADVRFSDEGDVDIICAQNFSYCVFSERAELRRYFLAAYEGLRNPGLFVTDLFGGYESLEDEREETTIHDGFEYVWEQHRYDPITAEGIYKIHFRFPDGSALEDAFVYDWRLWTIP